MKKNIMKEAHKLTREIKNQYPEVNYQAQLGLCLSFLAQEGGKEMIELKGSEKQIKWAEDIRTKFFEICNKYQLERMIERYGDWTECSVWINNRKYVNDTEDLIQKEINQIERECDWDNNYRNFEKKFPKEAARMNELENILDELD